MAFARAFRMKQGAGPIYALCLAIIVVFTLAAASHAQQTARTLVLDYAMGAYDDERVRDAVRLAVDWRNAARLAGQPVDNVIQRYADGETALGSTAANREKAKELLAVSGYYDAGIDFVIVSDQDTADVAQAVAAYLGEVGIPVKQSVVSSRALQELLVSAVARVREFGEKSPVLFLRVRTISVSGDSQSGGKPGQQIPQELLLADLVVAQVDAGYDRANRRLWARALIKNDGSGPTGSSFVVSFADQGGAISGLIARKTIAGLASGKSAWVEIETQVPDRAFGRVAVIQAIADPGNDVLESDDRNNTGTSRRILIERPDPPPKPDLVIHTLSGTYNDAVQELEIRLTVRNAGKASSGAFRVQIVDASNLVLESNLRFPALPAGDRESRTISLTVPDRAFGRAIQLRGHVDPENRIEEIDEFNNAAEAYPIPIPRPERKPLADLVIKELIPSFNASRQELSIRVVIANAGPGESLGNDLEIRELNGRMPTQTVRVNKLPPNGQTAMTVQVAVSDYLLGQTVRLFGHVDARGEVEEISESNNRRRAEDFPLPKPPPPPKPDLVIEKFLPVYVAGSQELLIDVIIRNTGKGEAGAHLLRIEDDRNIIQPETVDVPPLGPGKPFFTTVRFPVPDRALGRMIEMRGHVDFEDKIDEANDANNRVRAAAQLLPLPRPGPKPDLIVESVSSRFDPESGRLFVAALVKNSGDAAAQSEIEVEFSDQSGVLGINFARGLVPPLTPNAANYAGASLDIPEQALGRTLRITATADVSKRVDEADERNNISRTISQVLPPKSSDVLPDLIFARLDATFASDTRQLTVRAIIRNGGYGAAGPYQVSIAEVNGAVAAQSLSVANTDPGGSADVVAVFDIPDRLGGRSLVFRAAVDAAEQVDETDDSNNFRITEAIPIPLLEPKRLPDLTVTSAGARQDWLGMRLEFEIIVANTGIDTSPSSELVIQEPGGPVLGRVTVPNIVAGRNVSLAVTTRPERPLGGRTLIVEFLADVGERVVESDETNNSRVETLSLNPPFLPWAGAAGAVILGVIYLFRARRSVGAKPGKTARDAQEDPREPNPAPTHMVNWRPRTDPGKQSTEIDQPAPMITAELVLRPVVDPGTTELFVEDSKDEA